MEPQHIPESSFFRFAIGLVVMLTAIGGFAALFVIKVPPENKDAMMFALGSVFGWAASVVSSEYGATTTGRKVADAAVRNLENQAATNLGEQNGSSVGERVEEGARAGTKAGVSEALGNDVDAAPR